MVTDPFHRQTPEYEILRRSDDPVLVILRGHLLIEVHLRDILARAFKAPEELEDARLTFYHVLAVTRAIVGRPDDPVWPFIKRLNEVRNKIAHLPRRTLSSELRTLEPVGLDTMIDSVVELLPPSGLVAAPVVRLYTAVANTCESLKVFKNALESEARRGLSLD